MKKRVLLLAVSCKHGGLCPGGIDLDNQSQWIRIVRDDGCAGAVQGREIDFANPLDIIEFDGRPMPQGKQKENWVIDNNSCVNKGRARLKNGDETDKGILDYVYKNYSYHGFWNNHRAYLNEDEFEQVTAPSESILRVSNVRIYMRIYENGFKKAKIDFDWSGAQYRISGISMTDPNFYNKTDKGDITFDNAYIVISIPKECEWGNPYIGKKQAYKFVSKVFEI